MSESFSHPRAVHARAAFRDGPQLGYLWCLVLQSGALLFTLYAFIFGSRSDEILITSGILTTAGFLAAVSSLISARCGLIFLFVFFVTQPVIQVFTDIVLIGGNPLWTYYFPRVLIEPLLSQLFVLANLIFVVVFAQLTFRYPDPRRRQDDSPTLLSLVFALSVCITLSLALLGTALTVSRDAYLQTTEGGERFFVVLGSLAVCCGVAWGFSIRGFWMRALGIFCLLAGIAVALSGFRSVLVGVGVTAGVIYLRTHRIGPAKAIVAIATLFAAYYFMSFLNYLRNNQVTLMDIISGYVNIDNIKDTLVYAGRAEQIELYSVYYAQTLEKYYGLTYAFSLMRVLPNFIGEGILAAQRPQDILLEGAPHAFLKAGVNLGAYFFAEASLNFGLGGAMIVTILVICLLFTIERHREANGFLRLAHPALASMMPTLAIYGSANFFKQSLTILMLTGIFYLLSRIEFTAAAPRFASAPDNGISL